MLKNLKPSGNETVNVHCGLVQVMPMRRVVGCGVLKRLREFHYQDAKFGVWFSVSLCDNCLKEVKQHA